MCPKPPETPSIPSFTDISQRRRSIESLNNISSVNRRNILRFKWISHACATIPNTPCTRAEKEAPISSFLLASWQNASVQISQHKKKARYLNSAKVSNFSGEFLAFSEASAKSVNRYICTIFLHNNNNIYFVLFHSFRTAFIDFVYIFVELNIVLINCMSKGLQAVLLVVTCLYCAAKEQKPWLSYTFFRSKYILFFIFFFAASETIPKFLINNFSYWAKNIENIKA